MKEPLSQSQVGNHAFITGTGGFIGGYVVQEFLTRGWGVTALVHRNKSSKLIQLASNRDLKLVTGDATNYHSLQRAMESAQGRIDTVIHCAGRASDVGWRREFRRANLDSVKHLVHLTQEKAINRFVFISTTDVYGLRDHHGENETELPLQAYPPNPYPKYKIQAENVIRAELPAQQYAILRPAQVWGAGDTTLTARIVSFLKWSPWIVHFGKWRGRNRWPLAHVRNVAIAAYLAATRNEASGCAINVLDSEWTSIDEFYRMLAAVFMPEKTFKTVTLPFWMGAGFGFAVSTISNILNLPRPCADPSLYALYSVSRNLDFSNERFTELAAKAHLALITKQEGLEELQAENEALSLYE